MLRRTFAGHWLPTASGFSLCRPWVVEGLIFLGMALLLTGATWLLYLALGHPGLGTDDAYINFVYARNLRAGSGPVFNPQGPRVEGFSSPLWVGLLALAFGWGGSPEGIALTLAIGLTALALTVLIRALRILGYGVHAIGWLLLWTLTFPGFVFWHTLSLMDTPALTLGLSWATALLLTGASPWWVGAVAAALPLMRPEGIAWGGLFGLLHAGLYPSLGRRRFVPLCAWAISVSSLTLVRLMVFGHPLPNTYYAKRMVPEEALISGILYLMSMIFWAPIAFIIIFYCLSCAIFVLLNRELLVSVRKRGATLWVVSLVGLGLPLWTGADYFPFLRFYQSVWPIWGLLTLWVWRHIAHAWPRRTIRAGFIGIALGLMLSAALVFAARRWNMSHEILLARRQMAVAERLNVLFTSDLPTVGVIAAGGFRWAYRGPVVDLMGLNDPEMADHPPKPGSIPAHGGFSPDVFWRRLPHVLIPSHDTHFQDEASAIRSALPFFTRVLDGLPETPAFRALYRLGRVETPSGPVVAFFRQDVWGQLVAQGIPIMPLDVP